MPMYRGTLTALITLLLGCALGACSDSSGLSLESVARPTPLQGCADSNSCPSNPPVEIGEARPASVLVPSNYTPTTRYPLIIVLHGFGASGFLQSAYLGLDRRVDEMQYILVSPDGTPNPQGRLFWNATPGCCAPPGEAFQVNDVAYIRSLIEAAAATYSVDTARIGLVGHSNGGAMTLRLVCEASDLVTAAVSLAGWTFPDAGSCAPATNPVSVLVMHGTEDDTIFYDGAAFDSTNAYPGALETTRRFAAYAGCDTGTTVTGSNIDVDASIDGAETEVLQYTGCPAGIDVDLWSLIGSPHIPAPWVDDAIDAVVDWLVDHPRPAG